MVDNEVQQIPKNKNVKRYLLYLVPITLLSIIVVLVSALLIRNNGKKQVLNVEKTTTENAINPTPTLQVQVTPIPKTALPGEIITSANLDENCKITVISSAKTYEISTGLAGGMDFKCKPRTVGKISPSGKYLAYEDVSGGIDSVMALFSIDYGENVILGVWGTSTIMDHMFLPDDRLVSINGYPDIFDEQWLSLFDLPKIFDDFPLNFNIEYYYLKPTNPTYLSNIQLPNTGTTHSILSYSDNLVQTFSKANDLLVQYSPEYLVLNNGTMTISPKTALTLVFYYDKKNVDPVNSPITKRVFSSEKSTNEYWLVEVVNTKTSSILRSYFVDRKTGEVSISN